MKTRVLSLVLVCLLLFPDLPPASALQYPAVLTDGLLRAVLRQTPTHEWLLYHIIPWQNGYLAITRPATFSYSPIRYTVWQFRGQRWTLLFSTVLSFPDYPQTGDLATFAGYGLSRATYTRLVTRFKPFPAFQPHYPAEKQHRLGLLYQALVRRYPDQDDSPARAAMVPCEGGYVAWSQMGDHEDAWRYRDGVWRWQFTWSQPNGSDSDRQERLCHQFDFPETFYRHYIDLRLEALPY